jgi:hypothetical protein
MKKRSARGSRFRRGLGQLGSATIGLAGIRFCDHIYSTLLHLHLTNYICHIMLLVGFMALSRLLGVNVVVLKVMEAASPEGPRESRHDTPASTGTTTLASPSCFHASLYRKVVGTSHMHG